MDAGPEHAGQSYEFREGNSSQPSSSSHVRSIREGNSSQNLSAPPLWSGYFSKSLPNPSSMNQIVPSVRSTGEANSSQPLDMQPVRSNREGNSSQASTIMMLPPHTYGPARSRRVDIYGASPSAAGPLDG